MPSPLQAFLVFRIRSANISILWVEAKGYCKPSYNEQDTPPSHLYKHQRIMGSKLSTVSMLSQPGPCLRAVCPVSFSKEGSGSVTAYLGPQIPVAGKGPVFTSRSGRHLHYPKFPGKEWGWGGQGGNQGCHVDSGQGHTRQKQRSHAQWLEQVGGTCPVQHTRQGQHVVP